MAKVWMLVAAGVGVVVVIILVIVALTKRAAAKRKSARALAAHPPPGTLPTIFVCVVSDGMPGKTGETLALMFERAKYPGRVFVGVMDIITSQGNRSAVEEYESHARSSASSKVWKDHVRFLRMGQHQHRGILAAVSQIENRLYKGEDYVASLGAGCFLVQDWDVKALSALRSLRRDNVVLTCGPGNSFTALNSNGSIVNVGFRGKLPSTVLTVPALAWSSGFSLTSRTRTKDVVLPRLLDYEPRGMDFSALEACTTACLLAAGWSLYHPSPGAPILTVQPQLVAPTSRGSGSAAWCDSVVDFMNSLGATYTTHLGISSAGTIADRACLGLTVVPTDTEIVAKLGNKEAYESMLALVELGTFSS